MKYQRILPLALAAGLAIVPTFTAAPALAQSDGNDAAIGAAVGALVGTLLFDQNRDQYYYYQDRRPVYVTNGYAGRYFARRDPDYWREHQHEFSRSRGRFYSGWNGSHQGNWQRTDDARRDWNRGNDGPRGGDHHRGGDGPRGDSHGNEGRQHHDDNHDGH